MNTHEIKMAFRNIVKSKAFSAINIIGLSLGIAISFLIVNYVSFEFNYDNIHSKQNRIYRIESQFFENDQLTDEWGTSSFGYGKSMKDEMAGIEDLVRMSIRNTEQTVSYNEKRIRENAITYTEPSFFNVFDFKLKEGALSDQLVRPKTVVITEDAAKRFFGDENPIGKVLTFADRSVFVDCEVTGVMENFPANSHIQFDYLISYETLPQWMKNTWYLHEAYTYLLLAPQTDPSELERQFPEMAEKYKTRQALHSKKWGVELTPLTDIHLNPQKQYEREIKGNKRSLITLLIIAAIILLMGWFNYINLTTTQSMEKAKEVGVRKASGASRLQLVRQYLTESLILNLGAILMAAIIVMLAQPFFEQLTGRHISFFILRVPIFWASMSAMLLAGTLLSGLYPAFVMSSIKPATIMKGNYSHSKSAGVVRKSLVVFQFAASIFLICGTMIIYKQVEFMQNQDLGINIDRTIVLKYPVSRENVFNKVEMLAENLKQENRISSVTLSGSVPGLEVARFGSNSKFGDSENQQRLYEMLAVDDQFIQTFNLKMLAGQPYQKGFGNLSKSLVINEAAMKLLEIDNPQDAIGQQVMLESAREPVTITGVVKNWHQRDLGNNYTPIMLVEKSTLGWVKPAYIAIKTKGSDAQSALSLVKDKWQSYFPEASFDYFFLDQFFDNQYKSDKQYGNIVSLFTILAFIISVLGLWALASYTASKKVKEVGVRKVLGAETGNIIYLFSKEIILLVFISILVATPLSIVIMKNWLASFAFHAKISWWVYLLGGILTLSIALLTIFRESWKVSTANPIESIKYE